jgi:signal transduction histidine kinase
MVANFFKAKALNQLKEFHTSINLINATLKDIESTASPMYSESIEAHNTIAEAYEKTGQYQQALLHKNLYLTLHDSLLRKDRLDMINQLEIRYRIAEKDKEITRQKLTAVEAENRIKSKNFLLASSLFATLLLSITFFSWFVNSKNKQILQQEKINNIQQRIEIEKLSAAMSGEEKERTRIAHELHDGIGGLLTAAKLNFEAAKINAPLNNSADFHQGIHLLQEVSAELRNTAHHLMPEILLQGGLVEAVKYYTANVLKSKQTEIVIQVLGTPQIFNPDFELAVYRMIQELLQNVLKHAKAKNAIIQISYHEKDLAITVEDDGVGMPKSIAEKADGMGLTSIKERVKSIKGSMTINAEANEGTSIYLEFEYPTKKNELV